jgi:hypothetical protein
LILQQHPGVLIEGDKGLKSCVKGIRVKGADMWNNGKENHAARWRM